MTPRPSALNARARLASILTGQRVRDAATLAACQDLIDTWTLAALDPATFGLLVNAQAACRASITASANVLTDPELPFSLCRVGQSIQVPGAGAAGAVLSTTIEAITDAGSITLADAASTTVAATLTSAGGLAVWGDAPGALTSPTALPQTDGGSVQPGGFLFNGTVYDVVPLTVLVCNEADVQSTRVVLTLVARP